MTTPAVPQPAFWVGDIPVWGRAILSPLDGSSDLPFRAMARRLGSAMSYTEFVNAIDVVNGAPNLDERLTFLEEARPLVFQVFDDDPERLVEAVHILMPRQPDIIDITMGCSARTVASRGAGAGLLRTPDKIAAIFRRLSDEVDVPVTGKIRLGWDEENLNYLDVARIVQDNGGQLLAVHGRTKEQAYRGQANWAAIAEIKAALKIPVIGNGDVKRVADIQRMISATGCDGVMIARGAIGNPWIFAGLDRDEVSDAQVRDTMLAHLDSMLAFYGEERGLVLFRKHAARYITPYRLSKPQRELLLTAATPQDFLDLLDRIVLEQPQAA